VLKAESKVNKTGLPCRNSHKFYKLPFYGREMKQDDLKEQRMHNKSQNTENCQYHFSEK
jgi:hypothetical protein